MPGAAIRIDVPVGRLRQRAMDLPAFVYRRRSVDGGTRQRMTESHALADGQQPLRFRLFRERRRDTEPVGGTPEQQRISDWLRRREQHQTPCVIGERVESSNEAVPDLL